MLFCVVYLSPPNIFGTIDWVRIHVFYKDYARAALWQGRLPLWNPHIFLGRPFLADVDAATLFYPLGLPYLLLPAEVACVLVGAIHVLLAVYGSLRLAERLGARRALGIGVGFVFAFSAPIVGSFHSGLVHYGPALCYVPLVFALVMRLQDRVATDRLNRLLAILSLVLGLQLLAGHPQAAWLTWLGAASFLFARRWQRPWPLRPLCVDVGCFAVAVCLALGLASVTLLPLAELSAQSNRGEASLDFSAAFAMPPYAWASALVPSDPAFSFLANAQLYIGLAPAMAAALGACLWKNRNARALLFVAVVAALLAAGNATPLFRLFYWTIPGVSSLRLHSRASVLVAFALLFLAVVAVGQWQGGRNSSTVRRPPSLLIAMALVLVVQTAFVLWWPGFEGHRTCRVVVRVALTLAAGGTLLWAWPSLSHQGIKRRSQWALVGVMVLDLSWAAWGLKPQNRDDGDRPSEAALAQAVATAANDVAPARVSMPRPYARENAGMKYGWSSFTGYAALCLDRVWHHAHAVLGLPVPRQQNTYVAKQIFWQGPFPFDSMNLALGLDPQTRQLVAKRVPDPRAYLVGAAVVVADHREATRRMQAGHNIHDVALVESPVRLPSQRPGGVGSARLAAFAAERIAVDVNAKAPALMVLAEAWYPGWQAKVNGMDAPVIPVNAWMRGVVVPQGSSSVVFTYSCRPLVWGACATLITAAWVAVLFLRRPRCGAKYRVAEA
ncbi:MAG: hypothetical protein SF187_26310 [Deltaproteobacteria bacterium]|nr:hypothetical protein [Deltaproteobacteria bacterium]